MLQTIRKHKGSFLGLVVAGVTAFLMLGFGVEMFFGSSQRQPALSVDGEEIAMTRFLQNRSRLNTQLRAQYGANFEQLKGMFDVSQITVDNLVRDKLLAKLASELGLVASQKQVNQEILSNPLFSSGFDKNTFQAYLRALGLSEKGLEIEIRKEVIQSQLVSVLSDVSSLSERELRSVHKQRNAKGKFRYVEYEPKNFEDKVKIDEEELAEFFEDRAQNYEQEKALEYSFVKFDPSEFAQNVQVTDEDLEAYYEERRDDFLEPKRVSYQEVHFLEATEEESALEGLLDVGGAQEEEESLESTLSPKEVLKQKAEEFLGKLIDSGAEDIVVLAEQLKAAVPDTAIEIRTKDRVVLKTQPKEIKEGMRELEVGELSELIERDGGFSIVHLSGETPARHKSFTDIREQLENDFRKADAPLYAGSAADEFLSEWTDGDLSLASFAKKNGKKVAETEGFIEKSKDTPAAPLGLTAELSSFAAGTKDILEFRDAFFIFQVKNVRDAYIPELKDVREAVIADYRREEGRSLAKKAADALLARVTEKKEDLAELAKAEGLELKETSEFTRSTPADPLFYSSDVVNAAFALSPESPVAKDVFEVAGKFAVLGLVQISDPEEASFASEKETLRSSEAERAGTRLLTALIETLKAKSDIWINPDILDKEV